MKKISIDVAVGFVMMAVSLLYAFVISIPFVRLGTVPIAPYIVPAIFFFIGAGLVAFDFIEEFIGVDDLVHSFWGNLEDDIKALKEGKIKQPVVYLAVALMAVLLVNVMIFRFEKWNAVWWKESSLFMGHGFNVLLLTAIICVLITLYVISTGFFKRAEFLLPWYIFALIAGGFVVVLFIGNYYAEPAEWGGMSRQQKEAVLADDSAFWLSTRGSRIYYFESASDISSSAIDIPDCDDEGCLIIIVAIVVVLVVLGSIYIQHFWIAGLAILATLMLLLAIRDLQHRPRTYRTSHYR